VHGSKRIINELLTNGLNGERNCKKGVSPRLLASSYSTRTGNYMILKLYIFVGTASLQVGGEIKGYLSAEEDADGEEEEKRIRS
jgi:hypothetical protein